MSETVKGGQNKQLESSAAEDEIRSAVGQLLKAMDAGGGWSYDTYDVRTGSLYLWLYREKTRRAFAAYILRGLYALELAAPHYYRRVRGIQPTWDPMGNSYRAGACLSLFLAEDDERHLVAARDILDRVTARAVGAPGRRGFALGFPCITGSDKLWRTDVPVAHYTLRVARKFLQWERIFHNGRYQAILSENIRFLVEGLPWIERDGILGVAYTPDDPMQVLNIWADVASLLACYGRATGVETHKEKSVRLVRGVLAHQDGQGAWPYFARWERPFGGVDNSHTAMVLGALADAALCYPSELMDEVVPAIERGIACWLGMFFDESSGRFWNMAGQEAQSCSVCLGDALYAIHRLTRPELGLSPALAHRLMCLAGRIVVWSFANLRLPGGRFCERRVGWWRYVLESVRSFDGFVADALALSWASGKVSGEKSRLLWTI